MNTDLRVVVLSAGVSSRTPSVVNVHLIGTLINPSGHSMSDGKLPKSWPYDPEQLSYKEWIALPADEQDEVLEYPRQQAHKRIERDGPLRGKAYRDYNAKVQRLQREVAAEERRTGRVKAGTILMGEGLWSTVSSGDCRPACNGSSSSRRANRDRSKRAPNGYELNFGHGLGLLGLGAASEGDGRRMGENEK